MSIKVTSGNFEYVRFLSGSINLNHAQIASTFELTGEYDFENEDHKRLFKPLNYPNIRITALSGERILTGHILSVAFTVTSNKTLVSFSGQSSTGILSDCKIPLSSYPLEFNNLSLAEIAEKLIEPFGISLVVEDASANEPIPEVTADTGQSISSFLVEIASQRNLVVTNDSFGNLVITRAKASRSSTATYREAIPAVSISLSANGQNMHSEIGSVGQSDLFTDNASESSVDNVLVNDYRPTVVSQNTGDDNTSEDVAKNLRSNELRNIQVSIESDRWEWINAKESNNITIVKPNNIIDVIAPSIFVPNRTPFFVESVTLKFSKDKEVAILKAVPPQVYNGEDPKPIFK